jgi:hypothetical protein
MMRELDRIFGETVTRFCVTALGAALVLMAVHAAHAQQTALAADKIAPIHSALSVRQALEVAGALGQMNCATRTIKDGAKESLICEPYPTDKLKVGLAWQIAQNQAKVNAVVQTYQKERNRLLSLADRKSDGNLTDKASARFLTEDAELLDASSGVTLDRFKKVEIEPLNLQPGVIAALLPIIDEK